MRDRKLLDQTLPAKEAGTLVSPSRLFSRSRGGKVKNIVRRAINNGSVVMEWLQSRAIRHRLCSSDEIRAMLRIYLKQLSTLDSFRISEMRPTVTP